MNLFYYMYSSILDRILRTTLQRSTRLFNQSAHKRHPNRLSGPTTISRRPLAPLRKLRPAPLLALQRMRGPRTAGAASRPSTEWSPGATTGACSSKARCSSPSKCARRSRATRHNWTTRSNASSASAECSMTAEVRRLCAILATSNSSTHKSNSSRHSNSNSEGQCTSASISLRWIASASDRQSPRSRVPPCSRCCPTRHLRTASKRWRWRWVRAVTLALPLERELEPERPQCLPRIRQLA